jgi:gluconokinase
MTEAINNNQDKLSSIPTLTPKLFIVMGVSGSGKTVIGKKLAKDLNEQAEFEFLDADDFHSLEAKQRMAANLPLDDTMREPWILSIMNKLVELNQKNINVVLAFSGLKLQHRKRFRTLNFQCHYYYLLADVSVIESRLLTRKNHFFSAKLLSSQFLAMQEIDSNEKDVTKFDVSSAFDEVYQRIYTVAQLEFTKDRS